MEKISLPHGHDAVGQKIADQLPKGEQFQSIADAFKLLSDPTRVKLFWILCHCEECVVDLAAMMDMSSPAVSHHLRHLKETGLITCHRRGKEVYYKAAQDPRAQALHQMMETMEAISCPAQLEVMFPSEVMSLR